MEENNVVPDNNSADLDFVPAIDTRRGEQQSVSEEIGVGTVVTLTDEAKAMLDSADLGASKPVPKPVYKARPVEHATVVACGHKLEAGHFPRNSNCEDCWRALFETSPEGVASVHQLLLSGGTQAVIAVHGAKFTKHFGRYLQSKLLAMHQQSGEQIAEGLQVLDINAERTA